MSNEKRASGCSFRVFLGDEILPSYVGTIINHCKDPDQPPVFHSSFPWRFYESPVP